MLPQAGSGEPGFRFLAPRRLLSPEGTGMRLVEKGWPPFIHNGSLHFMPNMNPPVWPQRTCRSDQGLAKRSNFGIGSLTESRVSWFHKHGGLGSGSYPVSPARILPRTCRCCADGGAGAGSGGGGRRHRHGGGVGRRPYGAVAHCLL